jgi:hypothetical protein
VDADHLADHQLVAGGLVVQIVQMNNLEQAAFERRGTCPDAWRRNQAVGAGLIPASVTSSVSGDVL